MFYCLHTAIVTVVLSIIVLLLLIVFMVCLDFYSIMDRNVYLFT